MIPAEGSAAPPWALITGGTGTLGRAVAAALAGDGVRAVITGRDPARGEAVLAALPAASSRPHRLVIADVLHAERFDATLRRLLREEGPPWAVVHAIGADLPERLEATTLAQWEQAMAVNLRSAFLLLRGVLPVMRRQGQGSVVLLASVKGMRAHPEDPVYGAAKAGVIRLGQAAALEMAPFGVRVNVVCPGPVAADDAAVPAAAVARVPLGRAGTPEEIAAVVAFLCRPQAAFLTGAVIAVDGGKAAGLWPPLACAGPAALGSEGREGGGDHG